MQGRQGGRPLKPGYKLPQLVRLAHLELDGMLGSIAAANNHIAKGQKEKAQSAIDRLVEHLVTARHALDRIEEQGCK